MAFLFNGGPECAPGAVNPLSQALKGFNSDAALQRDLLSSRPVAGPSQFRHEQQPGAGQEDAEQFFARQGGPSFDLREVRQQLNEAERYSGALNFKLSAIPMLMLLLCTDWDRRFNTTPNAGPQVEEARLNGEHFVDQTPQCMLTCTQVEKHGRKTSWLLHKLNSKSVHQSHKLAPKATNLA